MTREENIAAAERFARENPEWVLSGATLAHSAGATVKPSVSGYGWLAGRSDGGGCLPKYFLAPRDAALALGLRVSPEEPTDAR